MATPALPAAAAVPRFYLFGEAPRDVDAHFLHLETIADRSAPLHGQIRPHMHSDLNHVFVILSGHGRVLREDDILDFSGPHILLIPAGCVHGFQFSDDISGYVLTIASRYLAEVHLTRHGLRPMPAAPRALAMNDRHSPRRIRPWLKRLGRELTWQAAAHRVAIEANLLGLLAEIERLHDQSSQDVSADNRRHQHLLARFREQVELNFRNDWGLDAYLQALRATEPQLRYACQKSGERAPMQILLERRLLEAKRLLIYSDLSIGDCSRQAGFEDPAYFSRLFHRHCGRPPRAYRTERRPGAVI